MDFKTKRRIIDSLVIGLILASSYLTGFLIQLDIGLMKGVLILPGVLVLLIAYTHLVLRKGRKYDNFAHSLPYELEKTLIFVALMALSYTYSITHADLFLASTALTVLLSLYVFAYRPHS